MVREVPECHQRERRVLGPLLGTLASGRPTERPLGSGVGPGGWTSLRTALVGAACTLWSPRSLNVHARAPSLAETAEIVHIPFSALFLPLFLLRHPSFEGLAPAAPGPPHLDMPQVLGVSLLLMTGNKVPMTSVC